MSERRVCDTCDTVISNAVFSVTDGTPYRLNGQDACSARCALAQVRKVYFRNSGNHYRNLWNQMLDETKVIAPEDGVD